jgi:hypothetical protein
VLVLVQAILLVLLHVLGVCHGLSISGGDGALDGAPEHEQGAAEFCVSPGNGLDPEFVGEDSAGLFELSIGVGIDAIQSSVHESLLNPAHAQVRLARGFRTLGRRDLRRPVAGLPLRSIGDRRCRIGWCDSIGDLIATHR